MKLSNKKSLIKNVVFISGLIRSGKALLCPIISSFNNTEKVNIAGGNFTLEQIPMLNYLGEMSDDVARFLLQAGMNTSIYDNAIGRNSNFRPNDYTSVWKYRDPMEYVMRLFEPDGDAVLTKLSSQNRTYPMMVHNGLWHADIWFNALPNLKLIHMQRSPIEIVYSWMGKGYGNDFYYSDRVGLVTFEYNKKTLPYHAYGWEDKYLSLKNVDRIIHMVNHIRNLHFDSYERLESDNKNRVLFIRHQSFTENPNKYLTKISNFIGEEPSNDTPNILMQENCPRVFDEKMFEKKTMEIKTQSSIEAFNLLMEMQTQFKSEKLAI